MDNPSNVTVDLAPEDRAELRRLGDAVEAIDASLRTIVELAGKTRASGPAVDAADAFRAAAKTLEELGFSLPRRSPEQRG